MNKYGFLFFFCSKFILANTEDDADKGIHDSPNRPFYVQVELRESHQIKNETKTMFFYCSGVLLNKIFVLTVTEHCLKYRG